MKDVKGMKEMIEMIEMKKRGDLKGQMHLKEVQREKEQ